MSLQPHDNQDPDYGDTQETPKQFLERVKAYAEKATPICYRKHAGIVLPCALNIIESLIAERDAERELGAAASEYIQWINEGGHAEICSGAFGEGDGLEGCDCGLAEAVKRYDAAVAAMKAKGVPSE